MVETSLELECSNCNNKFWYSGTRNHPDTVDCPNCNRNVEILEEG